MKLLAQRAGLPGNVNMITRSALTPLRESVTALPAWKAGHPANLPVNKENCEDFQLQKSSLTIKFPLNFQ